MHGQLLPPHPSCLPHTDRFTAAMCLHPGGAHCNSAPSHQLAGVRAASRLAVLLRLDPGRRRAMWQRPAHALLHHFGELGQGQHLQLQ